MSKSKSEDEISYTFASSNFQNLKNIEISLRSVSGVKSLQLNK